MRICLFSKRSPLYMHGPMWQLSRKQTSGENTADLRRHEHHRPLATHWLHCPVLLLSHSLLLSSDQRNWATVLSRSRRTDCWRRNDDYVTVFHLAGCLWRAHSHALLMQTMLLCGFIECTSLRDYDISNSELEKTEFKFRFINRTFNFRTSFNNSNSN